MLLRQATKAYTVTNKRDSISSKLEGEDHLKVIPDIHTLSMPCACLHSHNAHLCVHSLLGQWPLFNFVSFLVSILYILKGKNSLNSKAPFLNLWECSFDTCTLAPLNLKLKVPHVYLLPDSDIAKPSFSLVHTWKKKISFQISCSNKTSSVVMESSIFEVIC